MLLRKKASRQGPEIMREQAARAEADSLGFAYSFDFYADELVESLNLGRIQSLRVASEFIEDFNGKIPYYYGDEHDWHEFPFQVLD